MSVCAIDNCGRTAKCRGWCSTHYNRWFRNGDPQATTPVVPKDPGRQCAEEGCERVAEAKQLCIYHYKRSRYGTRTCSTCHRPAVKREWCAGHYNRWRKHGDPSAGEPVRDRAPNGAPRPIRNGYGYVLVWDPAHENAQASGYVLEHVRVMSEKLGRPLLPGENVHHINGVRGDNEPANLELWVTMQPSGQRPSDLVRYAQEILARYGDMAAA